MTCQSLSKDQQEAKNLTYECTGNCSSSGFTRNTNQACQGKFKFKILVHFKKNC
jgi:hypothetical protein